MAFATRFFSNFIKSSITSKCAFTVAHRNFHHLLVPPQSTTSAPLPSLALLPAISSNVTSGWKRLLMPFNSLVSQVAGFKVKGRLKRRCKDCYFVIRDQRHYVICKTHRRHKQMSMKKRDYKTWVLTHATQSKVRPY